MKTFLHHFETEPSNGFRRAGERRGSRTAKLPTTRQREEGEARIACPGKPREAKGAQAVACFAPQLWRMLKEQPDMCRSILNHYLLSARSERNGLEFKSPEQFLATQYPSLLYELGMKQEELQFFRYVPECVAPELWYKALHLKASDILLPAAPRSVRKATINDTGIKIVLGPGSSNCKQSPTAHYGVHYLLVMAGIWTEAISRSNSRVVDAGQALVVSVELPALSTIVVASPCEPYLGVIVVFDLA